MAPKILPVLLSFILLLLQLHSSAGQNAVKAAYWFSGSNFPVADIDSTLFTHLLCAFADLDSQNFQVTVSSENQARFSSFTRTVQQKNPAVKALLSIGGGNASKESFAAMASQAASRKSFIDSSINLARSLNFHGLDIDWEYPDAAQMSDFGTLLTEWRSAVAAEARSSGKPALLLTAAVTYSANYFGAINPTSAISNSLDWTNVMAYDFFYSDDRTGSRITGPPAALFSPDRSQVSGDSGIRAWIQSGLSPKKIVLGFPFFGHSLQLANANNHGFWAPTSGVVNGGTMSYKEIRQFIMSTNATKVFNATVVSDYCYSGTTWIGYDDTQSVNTKVKYAKDNGLLGYFAWQISQDDNWILSREEKHLSGLGAVIRDEAGNVIAAAIKTSKFHGEVLFAEVEAMEWGLHIAKHAQLRFLVVESDSQERHYNWGALRISNRGKIEDVRAVVYILDNVRTLLFSVIFSYLTKSSLKLQSFLLIFIFE
ncbi:class V chitinase [Citrus sinensis]|uniref:Class V chitinase n=1 Tax=Citrus sinensis TaxID=2711 RepID=A0ACB8P7L8_CITSI|nr:class V chitinase [Citrus sinensis]